MTWKLLVILLLAIQISPSWAETRTLKLVQPGDKGIRAAPETVVPLLGQQTLAWREWVLGGAMTSNVVELTEFYQRISSAKSRAARRLVIEGFVMRPYFLQNDHIRGFFWALDSIEGEDLKNLAHSARLKILSSMNQAYRAQLLAEYPLSPSHFQKIWFFILQQEESRESMARKILAQGGAMVEALEGFERSEPLEWVLAEHLESTRFISRYHDSEVAQYPWAALLKKMLVIKEGQPTFAQSRFFNQKLIALLERANLSETAQTAVFELVRFMAAGVPQASAHLRPLLSELSPELRFELLNLLQALQGGDSPVWQMDVVASLIRSREQTLDISLDLYSDPTDRHKAGLKKSEERFLEKSYELVLRSETPLISGELWNLFMARFDQSRGNSERAFKMIRTLKASMRSGQDAFLLASIKRILSKVAAWTDVEPPQWLEKSLREIAVIVTEKQIQDPFVLKEIVKWATFSRYRVFHEDEGKARTALIQYVNQQLGQNVCELPLSVWKGQPRTTEPRG